VGSTLQCPNVANGTAEGCLQTESSSNQTILGTETYNVGAGGKLYHAQYYGADGHDFEIGWNSVHDVQGCRGMQWFNSGVDSYNINLHDNVLYNVRCDAINLVTVNADQGFVRVFNNVVYHSGTGPDPGDVSNYACVNIGANGNPTTAVEVYNNTFYDCGSRGGSTAALVSPSAPTNLRNNIFYSISNEPYFESNPDITGSNNLFFGNGSGPSKLTNNLNLNPSFVSSSNFHLQSTSPAIGAGIAISTLVYDHDGLIRPGPPSIGAYEFGAGTISSQPPVAPTGLTASVQ